MIVHTSYFCDEPINILEYLNRKALFVGQWGNKAEDRCQKTHNICKSEPSQEHSVNS